MAEVLDSFEFTGRAGKGVYDWNSLLDGQIHKMVKGEDFAGDPKGFMSQARNKAAANSKGIRVAVAEDHVVLQAYDLSDSQVAARKARAEKRAATKSSQTSSDASNGHSSEGEVVSEVPAVEPEPTPEPVKPAPAPAKVNKFAKKK